MPSLDNLPGDQRAVLEMVLARGRSYDEIARLLSLDRAKVRERAQIALDTIGPHTEVPPAPARRRRPPRHSRPPPSPSPRPRPPRPPPRTPTNLTSSQNAGAARAS